MNAAKLLVESLENEGVEVIFGVPGEENIDVMDAILDSNIKFIVTRHETGAAFMAGMVGRLTGKPGVCLATLGPGATNMLTGVADANMDQAPIVALTGQVGSDRLHKSSHQTYDVVSMYRPITKWNASIQTPEAIPEMVRKAFHVAGSEKPGATHLELPEDVARMKVSVPMISPRVEVNPSGKMEDIRKASQLIEEASSPLILVGNGVTRLSATENLIKFAEKIQAPVTETFMGKGSMPNTHPLYIMTTGLFEEDYISCAFQASDLIITVGYDMTELPPSQWNLNKELPVLHIDSKNAEIDSHYPVEQSIIGDINDNLDKLINDMPARDEQPYYLERLKKQITDDFSKYTDDDNFPIKPQKIIADLRETLDKNDIVISDVGAHKMWVARMFACYEPNTCLISNGLASMGFALPSAIAAKLIKPDKKVVAVVGDGGLLMTASELETAVRLNLDMIILVWRDNGYGLIEWKQRKTFKRSSHVSFGNPSFTELASSFGAIGIKVEKTSDLKAALQRAMLLSGPVVIDCPVDYKENMKLTELLCKMECEIDK